MLFYITIMVFFNGSYVDIPFMPPWPYDAPVFFNGDCGVSVYLFTR